MGLTSTAVAKATLVSQEEYFGILCIQMVLEGMHSGTNKISIMKLFEIIEYLKTNYGSQF